MLSFSASISKTRDKKKHFTISRKGVSTKMSDQKKQFLFFFLFSTQNEKQQNYKRYFNMIWFHLDSKVAFILQVDNQIQ